MMITMVSLSEMRHLPRMLSVTIKRHMQVDKVSLLPRARMMPRCTHQGGFRKSHARQMTSEMENTLRSSQTEKTQICRKSSDTRTFRLVPEIMEARPCGSTQQVPFTLLIALKLPRRTGKNLTKELESSRQLQLKEGETTALDRSSALIELGPFKQS